MDSIGVLLGPKFYLQGTKRPPNERIFKKKYLDELALEPEDFDRDPERPRWIYTGLLEDVIEWYLEWNPDTEIRPWEGKQYLIQGNGSTAFSIGDSEEDAWRKLIGKTAFLQRSKLAELAAPDESLRLLLHMLSYLDSEDPDDEEHSYYADSIFRDRWAKAVELGQTTLPLGEWLKEMTNTN